MEDQGLLTDPARKPPSRIRLVIAVALFTLFAFGGAGIWLMTGVQERSLEGVVLGAAPLWMHVLLGVAMGLAIAFGGWWIIARPHMNAVRGKYIALIGPLMPSRAMQVLVSVCAGVGEELLFRGALQHWLGIPLTSLGFVALHGYLDPRDWRISSYGLYLVLAMMGLGWVAAEFGLLGPIIAHTIIDIVLIGRLVDEWKRTKNG